MRYKIGISSKNTEPETTPAINGPRLLTVNKIKNNQSMIHGINYLPK